MLTMPDADEIAADHLRPGQWRLARIELVNWGTFSGHVTIDVARVGHLFTGPSGSGKSSLLDAIAAVLTPDRWLRLNAAAQDGAARHSDRTLMSYVRGAWSRELDASADRPTTTFLRPRTTWSAVLLRYENHRDEPVVVVRAFHAAGTRTETGALKDARLFTRRDLGLRDLEPHVAGGIDARRMTSALPDALITTGGRHGRFHERVVRHFGFRADTTLHLLHKTQSAKNLGTLDALFRGFMLDVPDTFRRADNAVEQFVELDRVHSHVVDLRRQAESLRRVDAATATFDVAAAELDRADRLHEAVEPYTAALTLRLAREAEGPARAASARAEAARADAGREQRLAAESLETAKAGVREQGGGRVELLQERVAAAEREERLVERERATMAAELERVGAPLPEDAAQFAELIAAAVIESSRPIPAVSHALRDAASESRKALAAVEAQIRALRDHRSNIDPRLLDARQVLASAVGVPASALPFAGELISVSHQHAAWRGAVERVLAPFATTLLVRDEHLTAARRAAESRTLGVRVVIEAVPDDIPEPRRPRDPRSLVHRVVVADGPFAAFLRRRIATDYDYACVAHPDELDDVDRGVTLAGLIKRSARRYEKDDRAAIGDATRWILGGDTDARLDALLTRRRAAETDVARTRAADDEADAEREAALARREVFARLAAHTWERVDAASAAAVTAARRDELHALTARSAGLRDAQAAADRAADRVRGAEQAYERALSDQAVAHSRLAEIVARISELDAVAVPPLDETIEREVESRFRAEKRSLTLQTVDAVARVVQTALYRQKDAATRRARDAETRFVGLAAEFHHSWPAESAELTVAIEDRYGYRVMLEGILARGLPDREDRFRRLLRERSQDVVAHLLDDLRNAPSLIRERVLPVNASLGRSPFEGTDRFLDIDVKTTRTGEVDEFLTDLRRIVEGNWADESAAGAEQRFAVLQRVIGKLGSKDRVDTDWRTRVLDTRLHVSFLAREKDPAGRIVRVYDSAEGLSGGQRQKLVIFCLAAALRYQLTEEEDDVPRFGSIVLDEAFDKADTRYTVNAMDVFRAFGFHMILATPQKLLQTLEPYVGAVTAVSNPERNASRLANVVFAPEEIAVSDLRTGAHASARA